MRRFGSTYFPVLFLFCATAAAAQDKPAGPPPVMEVRGLPVDATADSAVAARAVALARGQRRAYVRLLKRVTLRENWPRLPDIAAAELPNLVESLAIAEEKTSPVRYLAKISVRFKAAKIHLLLNEAGIAYSDTRAKPALILPVWDTGGGRLLFEDENPWRLAWERLALREDDLLPLRLPLADLEDISNLGPDAALLGPWQRFQKLSARYGVGSVIAVHAAAMSGNAIQVDMLWHTSDGTATTVASYAAPGGEDQSAFLDRLAALVAGDLADDWKRRTLLDFGERNRLSVRVPFDSLESWNAVRKKLARISLVQKFELLSITRNDAQLLLHYLGDQQRLGLSLRQQDLLLYEIDGYWELRRRGAADG